MTEEVYVKECHFCGSAEIEVECHALIDGEVVIIDCLECGLKMEKAFPLGVNDGVDQLTDIWNTISPEE